MSATEQVNESKGPERILYICQPSYGLSLPASKRQFWARSLNPNGKYKDSTVAIHDDKGGSLLANAFNYHWANALNLQLSGTKVTHFLMLHDDVVPEDWWVDKLLDDIYATKADLVSVVIPIKDPRGLSSTAINDPNDKWDVLRRLTMSEVYKLPAVFSGKDCGKYEGDRKIIYIPPDYQSNNYQLLLNTGCWIADFTKAWRYKVHFEINDCIQFLTNRNEHLTQEEAIDESTGEVRDGLVGAWTTRVRPEDWNFSRQLNKLGCDIRATRNVSIKHIGEMPYPNDGAWGEFTYDKNLSQKFNHPLLSDAPLIEGWMTEEEGRCLAELATDKRVVEIGSYCGLSSVWMARTATYLYCIDTFDGRGTAARRPTRHDFNNNLKKYGVEKKVGSYNGNSQDPRLLEIFGGNEKFDMAFIDGSHDKDSVLADFELCERLVKADGLILFHDYGRPDERNDNRSDPDVTIVVNTLLNSGLYELVKQVNSVAVLKRASINVQESIYTQPASRYEESISSEERTRIHQALHSDPNRNGEKIVPPNYVEPPIERTLDFPPKARKLSGKIVP